MTLLAVCLTLTKLAYSENVDCAENGSNLEVASCHEEKYSVADKSTDARIQVVLDGSTMSAAEQFFSLAV